MESKEFVFSRELNLRNRGVLHQHIKEQPHVTQEQLINQTGWSQSYISKLLAWLERDHLIAWAWGINDAGKRRRRYIDSALLPKEKDGE